MYLVTSYFSLVSTPDIYHLPALLKPELLTFVHQLLARAPFVDGKATASDAARAVKNNLQVDAADPQVLPQLQQLVAQAINAEPRFFLEFYVARLYPFLFTRSDAGMGYGWHVDNPLMGGAAVRTDLAMTVFLDDPATYEGGELVIRAGGSETLFKPAAGDAVLYPCQYVHCVNPVQRGTRHVAVTWFQCSVRSGEQRRLLADLKRLHELAAARDPQSAETQLLLQSWSNLLRMWAEV